MLFFVKMERTFEWSFSTSSAINIFNVVTRQSIEHKPKREEDVMQSAKLDHGAMPRLHEHFSLTQLPVSNF